MNGGGGACAVCGVPADLKCAACSLIVYCGKEHQKEDWKKHKQQCRAYKVCNSPDLGRHLVATRDLKEDELVLTDTPLVVGPPQLTIPVCLSCYIPLQDRTATPCATCGWPTCGSPTCKQHKAECEMTMMGRSTPITVKGFLQINHMYECVMALRVLYLKFKGDGSGWREISQMEGHTDKRKGTLKQRTDAVNVINFIQSFLKVPDFTTEELEHVCGVLDVNSLEMPERLLRALYKTACLIEHSCVPNCRKTIDQEDRVWIRTVKPIQKGQHFQINYADPMWTTPARQSFLKESKYFSCFCDRCTDPTEMGTYFSCVKCQQTPGCTGYLVPHVTPGRPWKCNKCSSAVTDELVKEMLASIGQELVALPKGDVKSCENFIHKHSKNLHPNHGYITDAKQALLQLLGHAPGYELNILSTQKLTKKLQLAVQLMALIKKVAPDCWRLRGLIYWEAHNALYYQALKNNQVSKDEMVQLYKECLNYLEMAMKFLAEEPPTTPESRLKEEIPAQIRIITEALRVMTSSD